MKNISCPHWKSVSLFQVRTVAGLRGPTGQPAALSVIRTAEELVQTPSQRTEGNIVPDLIYMIETVQKATVKVRPISL